MMYIHTYSLLQATEDDEPEDSRATEMSYNERRKSLVDSFGKDYFILPRTALKIYTLILL